MPTSAGKELVTYLGVLLVIILLCSDPSRNQVIFHCMGQGKVVIPRSGHIPVLNEGVVEMPVESLLDLGHVLNSRNAPHADLLPLITVRLRLAHLDD